MAITPLRATLLIPESVEDVPSLRRELNLILVKLQGGALLLGGLKLDTQRLAVPVDPPSAGTPNLLGVNNAGTLEGYWWNGAVWVQVF